MTLGNARCNDKEGEVVNGQTRSCIGMEVCLHTFLKLVLHGSERPASGPEGFTTGTH